MRRSGRICGSTIVEALVASAILAVGMAAAAGMLTLSSRTTQASALAAHAVALAEREMEDLRSLVYASIVARNPFPSAAPDIFDATAFQVHSDVRADQPAANMKTIAVTVSWVDHGVPRSYVLQTIYTNIKG